MRTVPLRILTAALLMAVLPAGAFTTDIPSTGLPTASMFSATLLPDVEGVVSWNVLAQVEPVAEGKKMLPRFSKEILGLDQKPVRVQGFMMPLDMGDQQTHFLLSAVPPHCPFCLPAGPEALVEVVAKKRVDYGFEPIILAGKFSVLSRDPAGVLYRLTEAELVGSRTR